MAQHPTQGITGIKSRKQLPGERLDRQENENLSRTYIQARNRKLALSITKEELAIAQQRQILVERTLVERQATFLVISLRQKLLNLGSSYAHKFVGCDVNVARTLLREIGLRVLDEIKDLPNAASKDWLSKIEEKEG